MDARMKLDLIPSWMYLVAIGVLVAVVGLQEVRISGLETDVAIEQTKAATELSLRTKAALDHSEAMSELSQAHAKDQQTKEDTYNDSLQKIQDRNRVVTADNDRLRGKLTAFTSRDRRPGETDTAAIERYQGRLEIVGALLGESLSLLQEGGLVIEGRDLEVKNLLEQIHIDRAACTAVPILKTQTNPRDTQ
jgi:hypothetical protein